LVRYLGYISIDMLGLESSIRANNHMKDGIATWKKWLEKLIQISMKLLKVSKRNKPQLKYP